MPRGVKRTETDTQAQVVRNETDDAPSESSKSKFVNQYVLGRSIVHGVLSEPVFNKVCQEGSDLWDRLSKRN